MALPANKLLVLLWREEAQLGYTSRTLKGRSMSTPNAYPQDNLNQPPVAAKSKIVAGILGILIGSLGIHNFYLGNTKKAVIQLVLTLLVFTSPISAIWGLVEGILILVSKPGTAWHQDAAGNELQD